MRKQYQKPKVLWDTSLLDSERKVVELYGLKNKKELWRAETFLKRKRESAKRLLDLPLEKRREKEAELVKSLARLGLLDEGANLDSVLGLETQNLLERRLQTIVWRKNFALTAKQARQFITHGKIAVKGKKMGVPGYLVPREEENKISYYKQEMKLQPKEDKAKKRLAAEAIREMAREAEKAGKKENEGKEEEGEEKAGKAEAEEESGEGSES